MKKIMMLMLVFLATLLTYGQQPLELKIMAGADRPNTEPEQFYVLRITNIGSNNASFKISAKDKNCDGLSPEVQVPLAKRLLKKDKVSELNNTVLGSGDILNFYLKLSRNNNSLNNKWNCTEVKAVANNGTVLSNTILIKSLIPDPSKFN
ncbi:MAG: hypothetical protein GYB32_09265 [Algicola sp.]|nr:hypothetical protein [Algicola sp.]